MWTCWTMSGHETQEPLAVKPSTQTPIPVPQQDSGCCHMVESGVLKCAPGLQMPQIQIWLSCMEHVDPSLPSRSAVTRRVTWISLWGLYGSEMLWLICVIINVLPMCPFSASLFYVSSGFQCIPLAVGRGPCQLFACFVSRLFYSFLNFSALHES